MREMQRIRVGIRGMEWDCGCEESAWECRNLGGNTKNVRNRGGDAGNQGGNLSIAVEITWNNNENDKLKDWREFKIINLVSRIWHGAFLVNFGHI